MSFLQKYYLQTSKYLSQNMNREGMTLLRLFYVTRTHTLQRGLTWPKSSDQSSQKERKTSVGEKPFFLSHQPTTRLVVLLLVHHSHFVPSTTKFTPLLQPARQLANNSLLITTLYTTKRQDELEQQQQHHGYVCRCSSFASHPSRHGGYSCRLDGHLHSSD